MTRRPSELAGARDADTVGTRDLLFAVLDVYGRLFDRVLYLRGTSREELVERLATERSHAALGHQASSAGPPLAARSRDASSSGGGSSGSSRRRRPRWSATIA